MAKLHITATGTKYSTREFDGHPDDEMYLEMIREQFVQYLGNFTFTNPQVTIEVDHS